MVSNLNYVFKDKSKMSSTSSELNQILLQYLSNNQKLEEISKLSSTAFTDALANKSEAKLMHEQESIVRTLTKFKITNQSEAIKILNLWLHENQSTSDQYALILNVHKFLEKNCKNA